MAERNGTFASTFIEKLQQASSDDRILHKLCQYALHPVHQQLVPYGSALGAEIPLTPALLQLLYEHRREGSIPFGQLEQAMPPPGGISSRDWLRAVAQLSEYGLINWTPLEDKSGMGQLSGFAKINDFGVKVLEAGVEPPIRISIDKSRRTSVPQKQQAPIAASTSQQQVITEALEKVITAINQADVSEQEKNEAKSLLRKLLSSKAAADVLGAGAQFLAAKYFTG